MNLPYLKFIRHHKKIVLKFLVVVIVGCLVAGSYYFYNKKQEDVYSGYINEAIAFVDKEDYTSCIEALGKAIKVRPKNSKAYALRAAVYYQDAKSDESLKDTDTFLALNKDGDEFIYEMRGDIFRERRDFKNTLESYAKAYSLSSSTELSIVHKYAGALIIEKEYEKAYTVVRKYFDVANKDDYWEDVDIWLDRAMVSLQTHRCLESAAGAWHVLMRTTEGDGDNKMAEGIMSAALNDKECIDKDTFIKK
ncbi:MAG: hypothetical protein WCO06_05145 [Candidatus Roizmanbacteria bacterium]